MKREYNIEAVKYDAMDENHHYYLEIDGWYANFAQEQYEFEVWVNDQKVDCIVKHIYRSDVIRKLKNDEIDPRVGFSIFTGQLGDPIQKAEVFIKKTDKQLILTLNEKQIHKHKTKPIFRYSIDTVLKSKVKEKEMTTVIGWAIYNKEFLVDFEVYNGSEKVDAKVQRTLRPDLLKQRIIFEDGKLCGFRITYTSIPEQKYDLVIRHNGLSKKFEIKPTVQGKLELMKSYASSLNTETFERGIKYFKKNGFLHFMGRVLKGPAKDDGGYYHNWFMQHRVTAQELEEQKNCTFPFAPKISLIVATFNTEIEYLNDMIGSVCAQTYTNWELCIADGSDDDSVIEYIQNKYSGNQKIKYKKLDKNYGISGNMNAALDLAAGDYVGLYDHDDLLEKNCLFECVKALQAFPYDIVYTDEDKFNNSTKKFEDPNFKPDYNIDLFRSNNYITHFFMVNKKIIDRVGGMDPDYDGSQDYDFMFRCIEKANDVYHVPKVLYHWRMHPLSTAADPESKMYCYIAGEKAIQAHYDRIGVDATVKMMPKPYFGLYHTTYSIKENPLVSIVIPNMNHKRVLKTCIDSLYTINQYKNFEIIIIENNSTEQEIFDYYHELQKEHENIQIVYWPNEFNYSAINNFGVTYAHGKYILFLNNDTEVMKPDSLSEMVGCILREEVGIVGAKLLYVDNTVQHAGVVIGFDNYAGHVFTGLDVDAPGYMMRAVINCDYSAVTAACMLIKKSLFDEVHGFDEQFKVACNDVDLCLRIREKHKLVVYDAFALWHHYESKSRGYEDSEEKIQRFENEKNKFRKRWGALLEKGDPYYNPNFDIHKGPFEY